MSGTQDAPTAAQLLEELLDGIDDARRDQIMADTSVKVGEMWREIMGNGRRGMRDRLTSLETRFYIVMAAVVASPVVALLADDLPGKLPR